ncbi:3-coathanger stack domain-containing protein [Flavobacterium silvaticum]|uniref:T9SS type A sorting domain-containing protein n=1 Tax=Flavobacterium silvaticum TaxID=1852020 RepID=A0A972JF10_9FLAO|nr:3-coathanger stack domain-containing protein [Flavobacterium silvaticum]NMH26741.1 T9SS type A sorting domain-containing protein [Flavobacterium silvaticum]
MKNISVLYGLLLFAAINSFSQNPRNNHWQLGTQDVKVNGNTPSVTTITAAANKYGLATISDTSGNLLFYTDGVTVWNSTHAIMTNGTDLGLSVQNVVIVPNPGNISQYYVIRSVDNPCLCTSTTGGIIYAYSLVEFNAANPLGILLNINPSSGSYPESYYTKVLKDASLNPAANSFYYGPLVVTTNVDDTAYWVILQSGNNILSYKIDASGLNSVPVTSGFTSSQIYNLGTFDSAHVLINGKEGANFRITNDKTKLIGLQYSDSGDDYDTDNGEFANTSSFYQLNFNSTTGAFSNYLSLMSEYQITGFELSPNSGNLFYVRKPKPLSSIPFSKGEIVVKDLTNLSNPLITLNMTSTTTPSSMFTYLQKNDKGEIWVSSVQTTGNRNKYLHQIIGSNSYSASSVTADVLYLNTYSINRMPQLVLKANDCTSNLILSTAVTFGTDTRQASQTITASNTFSAGTAGIYHAGTSVVLTNGFYAPNTSRFRGYIEGCSGTYLGRTAPSEEEHDDTSAIDTLQKNEVVLYPNPTNGILNVFLKDEKISSISISQLTGPQKPMEFRVDNSEKASIDLSLLPGGLYLARIQTSDGKTFSQKFIRK